VTAIIVETVQKDIVRVGDVKAQLGITERTVKVHLASIYNKLGVDSRTAAIVVASQRGLLPKDFDV
jgi:NarL family two-component system response regulator YdfI